MWNVIMTIWLCLLLAFLLGGFFMWLWNRLFGKNCNECEENLRGKTEELEKVRTALSSAKSDLSSHSSKLSTAESSLAAATASLATANATLGDHAKTLSERDAQLNELKTKHSLFEKQSSDGASRIAELEKEIALRSEAHHKLEAEIITLRDAKQDTNVASMDVSNKLRAAENELARLQAGAFARDEENRRLSMRVTELTPLISKVEHLTAQVNTPAEPKIVEKIVEVEKIVTVKDEAEIAGLRAQVASLEGDLMSLNAKLLTATTAGVVGGAVIGGMASVDTATESKTHDYKAANSETAHHESGSAVSETSHTETNAKIDGSDSHESYTATTDLSDSSVALDETTSLESGVSDASDSDTDARVHGTHSKENHTANTDSSDDVVHHESDSVVSETSHSGKDTEVDTTDSSESHSAKTKSSDSKAEDSTDENYQHGTESSDSKTADSYQDKSEIVRAGVVGGAIVAGAAANEIGSTESKSTDADVAGSAGTTGTTSHGLVSSSDSSKSTDSDQGFDEWEADYKALQSRTAELEHLATDDDEDTEEEINAWIEETKSIQIKIGQLRGRATSFGADKQATVSAHLSELDGSSVSLMEILRKAKAAKVAGIAKIRRKGYEKGVRDDLKEIVGVGPVLEKVLNEANVWTFKEIALWTAADIAKAHETLGSFQGGRIEREDWVSQCKQLHLQHYGEDV